MFRLLSSLCLSWWVQNRLGGGINYLSTSKYIILEIVDFVVFLVSPRAQCGARSPLVVAVPMLIGQRLLTRRPPWRNVVKHANGNGWW